MRAKHLCQWLQNATGEEELAATNWHKVVAVVQVSFRDGTLADDSTRHTVVFITKRYSGDFRGIGLVEMLWKTVTGILNQQLTVAITFYDVLYGFQAGRGVGTSDLETKLIQQLTDMRDAVL